MARFFKFADGGVTSVEDDVVLPKEVAEIVKEIDEAEARELHPALFGIGAESEDAPAKKSSKKSDAPSA